MRSFAHMLLGISDRNKMVLWPGCAGRAEFSRQTKNVRSVRFVVKRRGCCGNLSGGVALIVWFTTNGMWAKNKNIYEWREQAIIRDYVAWSLLLLAAAVRTFAHMPLGISDRNSSVSSTRISSFLFRRTKSTVFRNQFSARNKTKLEKISPLVLPTWSSAKWLEGFPNLFCCSYPFVRSEHSWYPQKNLR